MSFTLDDLYTIIEESVTLPERLDPQFFSSQPTLPSKLSLSTLLVAAKNDQSFRQANLEQWQAIYGGETGKFEKRIHWQGFSIDQISERLGKLHRKSQPPESDNAVDTLPDWCQFLWNALSYIKKHTVQNADHPTNNLPSYSFLNPDEPFPFEHIYAPFIEYTYTQIIARTGLNSNGERNSGKISEAAQIGVQRDLLHRLSAQFWQVLNLEFSLFTVSNEAQNNKMASNEDSVYADFIQYILADGFVKLFRRYPVMARVLAQSLIFWQNSVSELYQRLLADWAMLEQQFNESNALSQVTAIQTGLSDLHRQHRTVVIVTFDNARKVVYKPKAFGLEAAYYQLLDWFNRQDAPLDFKVLALLDRGEYGWIEFANHEACQNKTELHNFFKRSGMLLCVIHVLQGTDAHSENVMACGAYPVFIDAETLFTPAIHYSVEEYGEDLQTHGIDSLQETETNSVLTTAFLPEWRVDANSKLYDMSALGHRGGEVMRRPFWENLNTESMRLSYEPMKRGVTGNSPFADTDNIPGLENFVDDVIDGFRQMYEFLVARRAKLTSEDADNPLLAFRDQPVRFVFRNTWLYGRLLDKSFAPENLMNGIRFSFTFEPLSKAILLFQQKPALWHVMQDEFTALNQLDIPYFSVSTSSLDYVGLDGTVAAGLFDYSGYEACLKYIKRLDEADLATQIGYIKGAIYAQIATEKSSRQNTGQSDLTDLNPQELVPLTPDELMNYAQQIGDEFVRHAVLVQGSANWISFDMADFQRYRYQPMGYSLYAGLMGVTVFLAAMENLCGGYRTLSNASLQPLFRHLQDDTRSVIKKAGLGGASGIGSFIYGLTVVSKLLQEPMYTERALDIAHHLLISDIEQDRELDVIGGAAGLLLSLLALHSTTPEPFLLDLALTCGEHLLNTRKADESSGLRSWPTQQEKLLCGFGHGAAGIALSLLRLFKATGRSEFKAAAEESIQYEQTLFLPERGGWRDGLSEATDQVIFGLNWCHGGPGFTLARLSGLSILDNSVIRRDVGAGINIAAALHRNDLDQCCCGIMGKLETMLVASQVLDQPSILEAARRIAAFTTVRAAQNEGYRSFGNVPPSIHNFGFFQGTAGIGYQLLRLAHPDKLPSILSWQVNP